MNIKIAMSVIALLGTLLSFGQGRDGLPGSSAFVPSYDCGWCGRKTERFPYCSLRCERAAQNDRKEQTSWTDSAKGKITQWKESIQNKITQWKKERAEKELRGKYKHVLASDNGYCHVLCNGQGEIAGKKIDAKLYVRYRDSDGWNVFVDFGIKLFSASSVNGVCRCGTGENFHNDKWTSSSSGNEVFYNGDEVALVNEMRHCSRFAMVVDAANGSRCSAVFFGVGEKVQELINYYNAKDAK